MDHSPCARLAIVSASLVALLLGTAGCSSPETTADTDMDVPAGGDDLAAGGMSEDLSKGVVADMAMRQTSAIYCNNDPPTGARVAPPPPRYGGGTCPKLMAGENTFKSSGNDRLFMLAIPKDLRPDEKLPVTFLWHWLGGSAAKFFEKGEVQNAVDQQRFLAIAPEAKKGELFKWPFNATNSQARMDEEFRFFDDMLACVAEQFHINNNCVASVGVSAGALFTDQLVGARGQYLSSGISLSGGVGGLIKPFTKPAHKLPMIVLWGGPMDICIVINFQDASHALEDALTQDGHFFLECVHNCKHGEPPFDAPPGLSKYAGLWQFVFDHPYWLAPGDSPYKKAGLPAGLPPWCGIGKGGAKPRTGACPAPGC